MLRCLNSGEESKLAFRLAVDWTMLSDVDNITETQLGNVRQFIARDVSEFQAPDVIRLYLKKPEWARQFVFAVPIKLGSSTGEQPQSRAAILSPESQDL